MAIILSLLAVVIAVMMLDRQIVNDNHDDEIRRRVDRTIARSQKR